MNTSVGAVAAGSPPGRLVAARPVRSLVPALALQEARRLMLHPLTLVGFAFFVVNGTATLFRDQGPRSAYETTNMVLTFYPGLLMLLAANLLATRDRRADSDELLAPLPGRAEERFLAQALASLAPAAAGLAGVIALHAGYLAGDRYEGVPTLWHLLGGPVTLVGACLFGLMLGVWLPVRAAGVVGLVALVVANVWLDGTAHYRPLGAAMSWARWGDYPEQWAGVVAGSPALHVGYLVSLCAMAFAAAWVRVASRRAPSVVLGVIALGSAVAFGIAQLP
jgi:hypothetical protein